MAPSRARLADTQVVPWLGSASWLMTCGSVGYMADYNLADILLTFSYNGREDVFRTALGEINSTSAGHELLNQWANKHYSSLNPFLSKIKLVYQQGEDGVQGPGFIGIDNDLWDSSNAIGFIDGKGAFYRPGFAVILAHELTHEIRSVRDPSQQSSASQIPTYSDFAGDPLRALALLRRRPERSRADGVAGVRETCTQAVQVDRIGRV